MAGRSIELTLTAPGISALRIAVRALREIADDEDQVGIPPCCLAADALEQLRVILDAPPAIARKL
jgi:hypothetical protein